MRDFIVSEDSMIRIPSVLELYCISLYFLYQNGISIPSSSEGLFAGDQGHLALQPRLKHSELTAPLG